MHYNTGDEHILHLFEHRVHEGEMDLLIVRRVEVGTLADGTALHKNSVHF